MEYTISKYNRLFMGEKVNVLYNCASDGLLVLIPQLTALWRENLAHVEKIAEIHEEFFEALKEKEFIVESGTDETARFIERIKEKDRSPERIGIIINPTMDCNLRCWYCYEQHKKGTTMPPEVLEAVKNLIRKKTESPALRHLSLSFFGGEPLMQFRRTVQPLLEHARQCCETNDISLFTSFTTNAVLLTDSMIEWLKPFNERIPIGWQITLDGYKGIHDKSRITEKEEPTYDIIVRHIKKLIRNGMEVGIRFNYTWSSLESFVDVMEDFADLSEEERNRIHFDFQQVWQETRVDKETVKKVKQEFKEENYNVTLDNAVSRYRCYADKESDIVINYNGDLYKCTAREFNKRLREGVLSPDGELIWNNLYHRRMAAKYTNETCRSCSIYPLCLGPCSQKMVEYESMGCFRNLSGKEKEELIMNRVQWMLQQQAKS